MQTLQPSVGDGRIQFGGRFETSDGIAFDIVKLERNFLIVVIDMSSRGGTGSIALTILSWCGATGGTSNGLQTLNHVAIKLLLFIGVRSLCLQCCCDVGQSASELIVRTITSTCGV